MNWRRWTAFVCALALLSVFSSQEPAQRTDAAVELEVDGPPLVALTFDDGPRRSTTGPLLEGLALREVSATFFLVGNRIPGNEELIREMKRGQIIACEELGDLASARTLLEEYLEEYPDDEAAAKEAEFLETR